MPDAKVSTGFDVRDAGEPPEEGACRLNCGLELGFEELLEELFEEVFEEVPTTLRVWLVSAVVCCCSTSATGDQLISDWSPSQSKSHFGLEKVTVTIFKVI